MKIATAKILLQLHPFCQLQSLQGICKNKYHIFSAPTKRIIKENK
jgi:hypothetical protein